MIDLGHAAERRYRMGLVAEQAGIATEEELVDIITIGMRAKHRAGLVGDALENVRVDIEHIKYILGGITR